MNRLSDKTGWLVVAHGSRRLPADDVAERVGRCVADLRPGQLVEAAYLQFQRPTIAEGVARLEGQGAGQVVVVPLLFTAGAHVTRDLPTVLAEIGRQYSGVRLRQVEHIGAHPNLVALAAKRFRAAVEPLPSVPASETALLLVAHGSRETAANEETRRFLNALHRMTAVADAKLCFLTFGEPSLDEAIEDLNARGDLRRVVVQPYFFSAGYPQEPIRANLDRAVARRTRCEWLAAAPLGVDRLLVEAVVERLEARGDGDFPSILFRQSTNDDL